MAIKKLFDAELQTAIIETLEKFDPLTPKS